MVEIAKLLAGERVAVEACWIGAPLQKRSNLVVLESMVIVGVIEPRRSRRRNPTDVGERIRRRGVVMGRTNGGGTFIGVTN